MIKRRIDCMWDETEGMELSLLAVDSIDDVIGVGGISAFDILRNYAFMDDPDPHLIYIVDERDLARMSSSSDFVVQFSGLLRRGKFSSGGPWHIRSPTPYDLLVSTEVGLVTAQQVLVEMAALGRGNAMRVIREVDRGVLEVFGTEPEALKPALKEGSKLSPSKSLKLLERVIRELYSLPL